MTLDPSSRNKLNRHTAVRFSSDKLFDRVARAVCEAECLPRKELYESWECARRIRRTMRGGTVFEVAAGHGLLSALLLILDDSSPTATVVDVRKPLSHERVLEALIREWPRLDGRIEFLEAPVSEARPAPESVLASVHACGGLTDEVLDLALATPCRVAVLPCCHDLERCDTGELSGWVDGPLAVDVTRAQRMRAAGFRIHTSTIPSEITPQNRLLMAWPTRTTL